MTREKKIIKASFNGILLNLFLVIFKSFVGIIANSISIILDALNNFSDMISAVITIVGAKLSHKAPDKEHPYGHGRIEYLAATIISLIVAFAGVMALKESIEKIITPVKANYSISTFIVIIVAIFAKFLFSGYIKKIGKEINSQSLIATRSGCFYGCTVIFFNIGWCIDKLDVENKYRGLYWCFYLDNNFEICSRNIKRNN